MDLIVDSSVWFEYFKRKDPFFNQVQTYLEIQCIRIIDPVIGEILQGALNQNELDFIRAGLQFVPKFEIRNLFEKAGQFSLENKLISKGIGLIDACLIYTTIETDSQLWTLDKKILNFLDKKYLYD